ncbi:subtilase [Neohortaea acidophila]|uniref:Subtilase n=1 Tax=Neohortaea acidophila TaxID=245834 RepID=A0A6A6PSJ6_9PEZI|nr:subtilase [Neohortaea acidophila]KAF2482756.1 subtilase [Neohortaea acidophila]
MKGAAVLALAATALASPLSIATIHSDAAPVISATNAKEIPDSYIIKFKDHVTQELAAAHHGWVTDRHTALQVQKTELRKRSGFEGMESLFNGLKHTYNIAGGFLGYSGHFDEDVIEEIRRHPDVELIEKDQEVHTLSSSHEPELEKNAPWGLARISHRDGLSWGTVNKYLYSGDGGEGVDVYVIDTGTYTGHVDFEGRAHWHATIPDGDEDKDGNGHGTHCSGTIAGKKYGVAKKANVYAIKVLRSNGSGTMSDVVKGVEEALNAHKKQVSKAKDGKRKGFKGSTANMSLGGGKSQLLDDAVNAAVEGGIHFAVAAGNDNADSCSYSPAAAKKAVTVGASTLLDERAYFSNFGPCNDIFAPGLNIMSTWIGSKYAVNTISGTSMASPHIAGLLAYMLSLQPSKDSAYALADITPKKLKANLISIGTVGALSEVPSDTDNILAWNGGGESNYSSIIEKGSYTAATQGVTIEMVQEEIMNDAEKVAEEARYLTKKIEQFVSEEIAQALRELSEA